MTTILEKLFYFLAPHDCIFCGIENNVVCDACRDELIDERLQRCHVCLLPSPAYEPCRGCRSKTALDGLYVLGAYDKELREVVSRLKFTGARQTAHDLAPALASLLPVLPANTVITHLPTADRRVRERGFDQAALLAEALAARVGRPHLPLLRRRGATRQVGARKETRQQQAGYMFDILEAGRCQNKPALIVDDVATTGASMEAAARQLRQNGASEVYGVVVAAKIE